MTVRDSLNIAPSPDRRSARLTFSGDDGVVELDLSASELDAMIQGLAAARATLSPPVPTSHVNVPVHPPVQIQGVVPAHRIAGKRLIMMRHPGLGWLSFELAGNAGTDLAAGILSATHSDRDVTQRR